MKKKKKKNNTKHFNKIVIEIDVTLNDIALNINDDANSKNDININDMTIGTACKSNILMLLW